MGRKKKYLSEEEKKEARRKRVKENREKNIGKIKEYYRKYRENNIEKIRELSLKSYHKHKEEHRTEKNKKQRENYNNNIERHKTYQKNWKKKNPIAYRASYLRSVYNQLDLKNGRGKGDLTTKWIIENIFSKPCAHCGKTGWQIIGCNRLNNDLPHTMDNVEPCCLECNLKLPRKKH